MTSFQPLCGGPRAHGRGILQAGAAYAVVIRSGRVPDGAGNPWISGDVDIANGRFVRVGYVKEPGKMEIDARGNYVSPGRIDSMDMDDNDVKSALTRPSVSIGTDSYAIVDKGELALVHPRTYGTFPRVIGKYVRDEKVLTLPEALRQMTSLPAVRLGLSQRGEIPKGAFDAVIFDYDAIEDMATYDNASVPPRGISQILVNSVVVFDHGKSTGARPGHIIRGPGYCASNFSAGASCQNP